MTTINMIQEKLLKLYEDLSHRGPVDFDHHRYRHIHLYIYRFPLQHPLLKKFSFHVREDISGDFYIKVRFQFTELIKKYLPESGHEISAFIYHCLSRILLRTRSQYLKSQKEICQDHFEHSLKYEDSGWNPASRREINHYLQQFSDEESYLLLKLYFFDFFDESDFVRLQQFTARRADDLIEILEDVTETLHQKKQRQLQFEERSARLYNSIVHLQYSMNEKQDKLANKQIQMLRERQAKYIENYQSVKMHPPTKLLADVFQKEEKVLNDKLRYLKNKLQTLILSNSPTHTELPYVCL